MAHRTASDEKKESPKIEKCSVCKMNETDLTRIRSRYLQGEAYEKIAADFGIDYDVMKKHCKNCIKASKTRLKRYDELVAKLEEDFETARETWQMDAENHNLAIAYKGIIQEYRTAIDSREKLISPEDQVTEITDMILNPLFKNIMKALTDLASKQEVEFIGIGAKESKARRVTRHFVSDFGSEMKTIMASGIASLHTYYGVEKDKLFKQF